jgi:uncharacterized protein (DUF58 family)
LIPRRLFAPTDALGVHKKPSRGFSRDFFQHRPYVPGDEIRSLDWKAYARLDRFYVREFEAENLFTTQILLDCSGSMAFSANERASKWDYACRLSLAIAYLTLTQGDAVGLITVSHKVESEIPPRSAFPHLDILDSSLSKSAPAGESNANLALTLAASRLKGRSLVVFISDLLGENQSFLKGIRALKTGRNEVIVFQVLDPQERDFDFKAPIVLEGLEREDEIPIDNQDFGAFYREEFEKQMKLYQTAFHHGEIAYSPFFTDRPFEESLGRFLRR